MMKRYVRCGNVLCGVLLGVEGRSDVLEEYQRGVVKNVQSLSVLGPTRSANLPTMSM
jgi:hypothetical protein